MTWGRWPAWPTPWWSSMAWLPVWARCPSLTLRISGVLDGDHSAKDSNSRWTMWVKEHTNLLLVLLVCHGRCDVKEASVGVKYRLSWICVWIFICVPFSHVQEAKKLIAQAYRHTEKLILDNRGKLILVRSITNVLA